MEKHSKVWLQRRRRISEIIEVGTTDDWVSRGYDLVSTLFLLINVVVTVLYTFDEMELHYGKLLLLLEGNHIILYSQERISNASLIQV